MYRGTSPIFDVPEVPLMRRIKPLPKRRRMSPADDSPGGGSMLAGLPLPAPDASAEDLLAHADSLSSSMALQSYYLPSHLQPYSTALSRPEDDDDRGDGDYSDHLQQPGNTKKRKVPANMQQNPAQDSAETPDDDQPAENRAIPTGRLDQEPVEPPQPPPLLSSRGPRKSRLRAAAIAGLQHKEMLKVRKRQLASVLGALSYGDPFALDQALSATFPTAYAAGFDDPPKVRMSARRTVRMARATRLAMKHPHPDQLPLISHFDFTFSCPSPTAERLVATKEEVASLRARFEEELAKQAAKAAQLAAANKAIMASPSKGKTKKGDRAKQRVRTSAPVHSQQSSLEAPDQSLLPMKPKNTKKKKRSALANASNPHHLRNYVPSRLPHSGGQGVATAQATINQQNLLSPLPLAFLAAEIPPRRKKKSSRREPMVQLTNPADEWICPYCEYELFYGNDQDYRRAIRNRKKILRRRRRARERASAAAGGNVAPRNSNKENEDYEDDEDEGYDNSSGEEFVNTNDTKHKWEDTGHGRGEQGAVG